MEKFPIPFELFRNLLETPEKVMQLKGFGPEFITVNTRLLTMDFQEDSPEDSSCE